jgi:cytochrome oxidase Cu insertion factor (SCO1/SenC/PrrC family)
LPRRCSSLFITIDPARGKARVMTAYLKAFDPRITGLRGAPEQIDGAVKQFQVHYRLQRLASGGYTIDHSGFIYVVNPEGALTEKLVLGGKLPAQQMANELRELVK